MRTWTPFLLLVACFSQTGLSGAAQKSDHQSAEFQVPPSPASDGDNVGTRPDCPDRPPYVNVIQPNQALDIIPNEDSHNPTQQSKDQQELQEEAQGDNAQNLSTHEDIPRPSEGNRTTQSAEFQVPPSPTSDGDNVGTRPDCPDRPPYVNVIQPNQALDIIPNEDSHNPTQQSKDQQKLQKEAQGDDPQNLRTHEDIPQPSECNKTMSMAPAENETATNPQTTQECPTVIIQEPATVNIQEPYTETTQENTTVITQENSTLTTQEPTTVTTQEPTTVTTQEPTTVTTQEPTTVTTEDPNFCRRNGFMKPWPQCKEAVKEDTEKLAEGLTKFSLSLFQQILGNDKDTNVVFSPVSVAMVLSHLLLGARGSTKDLLLENLFDVQQTNSSDCIHATLRNLNISDGLESASGMFYRKDLPMNDFFVKQSKEFYDVEPVQLKADASKNLKAINDWVEEKTHSRIKKILDDLPGDVRLVLLNAIFFKGKWQTTFDLSETKKQTFHLKTMKKHVMMMNSKKYPLVSVSDNNLKAKVARFPLSQNMSMLIFLPQFIQNPISDLEEALTHDIFQAILSKLDRSQVKPTTVTLPKFKVETTLDLLNVFNGIDMSYLFHGTNLCGISSEEQLVVTGGSHRAVLKMDENGVVAAAATAISVARTAYIFEVRQPFVFVVWSDMGKFPVMMGRINDPST